jgi:hypothetical protein
MQLDRLAVELRQRNGFESLDLGFAMYAAWRPALWRAWGVTYVPTALVVSLVLWEYPTIALLVMWWLKPLFDRVLLYVYSEAMFGVQPTARDVLRAIPQILRRTRLIAGLTTFRFSMARSLFLPVWQLEGQRGPAARARRRVLGARTYGYGVWLTFVCVNIQWVWTLGTFLIAGMLMPEDTSAPPPDFSLASIFLPEGEWVWRQHATNLVSFMVDTVIEPYFVAAGFSLYLNRRSELEGWDLEVEFRRMAQRHATARTPLAAAAALIAVVVGLAMMPVDSCTAAEPPPATPIQSLPLQRADVKRELKTVLDDPVFGRKETDSRWVTRADEKTKTPAWMKALRDFMKRVAQAIGEVGRVAIWVVGGALLALAIYLLIKHHERWRNRNGPRVVPQTIFGLDVRPASLPDDIAAAARAALAAGDITGALSLLYRGALSTLIHAGGVDFRSGDTEGECWRRAAPVLSSDGSTYFRSLLDAWLVTAYAHRPPPVANLMELCDRWPAHFHADAFAPAATQ